MMGFGVGFGILGLLFMPLFWGGLILLAVWLVKAIFSSSSNSHSSTLTQGKSSTEVEILSQRYARGVIHVNNTKL
jgi:uncharacterized membrane protein